MRIAANKNENECFKHFLCLCIVLIAVALFLKPAFAGGNDRSKQSNEIDTAVAYIRDFDFESLRLAIKDLTDTFGAEYPKGRRYLERLDKLKRLSRAGIDSFDQGDDLTKANLLKLTDDLKKLRRDALLSNPLLDFDNLLLLKRKRGQLGLPVNHKCNSGIKRTGYYNEIVLLSPVDPSGRLQTLFRPPASQFVGEIDLHFDADRMLFTMPKGKTWQIFEINVNGSGLRQVSRSGHSDVDNFDACYLPDDRIVFASTAS